MATGERRRLGWPVLAVLVAVLGVFLFVVWRADVEQAPVTGGATIGEVEAAEERGDADTWQRHGWAGDGGLGEPATEEEGDAYDPQWAAMERSYGAVDAGGLPFAPITRTVTILEQEGRLPGPVDAPCRMRILPAQSGLYDCVVRVSCGRTVLYPNPSQTGGFVTCEMADGVPVRVEDRGDTEADGDPRIVLDLRRGTVAIADGGDDAREPYAAELAIEAP